MPDTDEHDWHLVTAPNGDQGFQCQRCKLTAVRLPVAPSVRGCPPPPPLPTLRQLLDEVRNRRSA